MTNDFKKGFLIGCGGFVGILFIPIGILILFNLIDPIEKFLQKKSYLNYSACRKEIYVDAIVQTSKEGHKGEAYDKRYEEIIEEDCGEKPKRWKWQ